MKNKTYLFTFSLFLLFLNGVLFFISVSTLKNDIKAEKEKSLTRHFYIASSFAKDLDAYTSREIDEADAAEQIYLDYTYNYGSPEIYLTFGTKDNILYSMVPDSFQSIPAFNNTETTSDHQIISQMKWNDKELIQVYSLLQSPYDSYFLQCDFDISPIIKTWRAFTMKIFLGGFLLSIVFGILLWFLFLYLFRPFRQISHASKEIAEGNYTNRLNTNNKDELHEMAVSFNRMAEEIEKRIMELEDASEQKQWFIDNFAHELRTPLTSIYGYAELIQKVTLSEEEKIKMTGHIMSETKRLQQISCQLLDMALLREAELEFREVSLNKLFHELNNSFKLKAAQLHVNLNFTGTNITLQGDPDLLKTALSNFIDNSLKACTENDSIEITAEKTDHVVFIQIEDTGKGVEEKHLKHIMEPFYRTDQSRNSKKGGAGLGLALCSKIIALHGGTIDFTSAPDIGTEVKLSFTTS